MCDFQSFEILVLAAKSSEALRKSPKFQRQFRSQFTEQTERDVLSVILDRKKLEKVSTAAQRLYNEVDAVVRTSRANAAPSRINS